MKIQLAKMLRGQMKISSPFEVRKLDLEGAELVEALKRHLSEFIVGTLDPDLAGKKPDKFLSNLQNGIFGDFSKRYILTAYDEDVIGILIGMPEEHQRFHIYSLHVSPEYRKKGVGSALLARCINDMCEMNVKEIIIDVHTDNKPAWNLYEKFGFRQAGNAQDFSIRFSSIKRMLELCKKLKAGNIERQDVENMLKHEDYKFELARYEGRVTEGEFADYFLKLSDLTEKDIENNDLKIHHMYYEHLLDNLEFYERKLKELEALLTPEMFEKQVLTALNALPDDIELPELNFVFTISIGPSFGYVHENGTHFDFLQLARDKSMSEFCSTISHEVHHVGVNAIHEKIDLNAISLEALFYLYFSGEGLAVKYCNNAEGVLSKSIHAGRKNIGLDSFTWKYLNDDFHNAMAHFRKTISDIRSNNIKSAEELNKDIWGYWMNSFVEGQDENEVPKLKQTRLYSFGNDIWGLIHDCFGKEAVFETMRHPETFPDMFNKALDEIGHGEFKI